MLRWQQGFAEPDCLRDGHRGQGCPQWTRCATAVNRQSECERLIQARLRRSVERRQGKLMGFTDKRRSFSRKSISIPGRTRQEASESFRPSRLSYSAATGVDRIAARIVRDVTAIMQENTPYRGGQYVLGTTAGGENMHVEFGRLTGATPDGRLAGAPLASSVAAAAAWASPRPASAAARASP